MNAKQKRDVAAINVELLVSAKGIESQPLFGNIQYLNDKITFRVLLDNYVGYESIDAYKPIDEMLKLISNIIRLDVINTVKSNINKLVDL